MLSDTYPLRSTQYHLKFMFLSFGSKGILFKLIEFEKLESGNYNLAFGDLIDGKLNDAVISNNFDVLKTISTVAKAIYIFFENYPTAVLEISAIDEKRLKLYNRIFARRHAEIDKSFILLGVIGAERMTFKAGVQYHKFEIQKKRS